MTHKTRDVNETRETWDSKKFLGIENFISHGENFSQLDHTLSLRSFNDSTENQIDYSAFTGRLLNNLQETIVRHCVLQLYFANTILLVVNVEIAGKYSWRSSVSRQVCHTRCHWTYLVTEYSARFAGSPVNSNEVEHFIIFCYLHSKALKVRWSCNIQACFNVERGLMYNSKSTSSAIFPRLTYNSVSSRNTVFKATMIARHLPRFCDDKNVEFTHVYCPAYYRWTVHSIHLKILLSWLVHWLWDSVLKH